MLRSLVLFAVIAVLHFALSVAGLAVGLRAAFDLQTGFWTAPVRITLAWIAGILLAPLAWLPVRADFGYGEIAAVSALFGAAAVALRHAWRAARRSK